MLTNKGKLTLTSGARKGLTRPVDATATKPKKVYGFRLSEEVGREIYRLAAFYPKPGGNHGPSDVRVIEEAVKLLSRRHPQERARKGSVPVELKEKAREVAAAPEKPEPSIPHYGRPSIPALSARRGAGAILKPGGKII